MLTSITLRPALALACLIVLGTGACATDGPGRTSRADAHLLTLPEIQALEKPTAYEAIRWLRPEWLRSRGGFSQQATATVYVDGLRRGGSSPSGRWWPTTSWRRAS